MKKDIACTIRAAKNEDEVRELWVPLTSELHWNRSPEDATTHVHSATLNGWLIAIPAHTPDGAPYPPNGKPQGCVVVFKFSNSTGWLSFFVTTAPYRGYGLGRELFQAGMDYFHASDTQYIGLDSVAEQRETYKRRGFVETNLIAIYERPHAKDIPSIDESLSVGEEIVDLKSVSLEKLADSDLAHCGLDRRRLWTSTALFDREDATGFAVVGSDQTLEGWILVRKCEFGYRFGPVYASRKGIASVLIRAAMENVGDKSGELIAETWHSNKDVASVFGGLGWKHTDSFHRMWYNGKVPEALSPGGPADIGTYAVFDAAQG